MRSGRTNRSTMCSARRAARKRCIFVSAITAARLSSRVFGAACCPSLTRSTWIISSWSSRTGGYDELAFFHELRGGIALGVGVVDIKDNEVEPPDEIAGRIDPAVTV